MTDSRFSRPLIYMLIGSAIILALSLGIRHAFGLYLVPMSHEFGWSHQVFSLAIAIQNLYINIYVNTSSLYGGVYGFLALFVILYCLIKSIKLYNISKYELWHVNSSIIKNTPLHSAYIIKKETEYTEYQSYLKFLLS